MWRAPPGGWLTVEKWGAPTLGKTGVNLIAVRVMLIKEPVVSKPKNPIRHSSYETECRDALRPHLDAILDLAVKAGWDRNMASYSLMYLAAKTSRPAGQSL